MAMTSLMEPKPKPASWEQLVERGKALKARDQNSPWEWGDIAIEADPTSEGSSLRQYAEEVGVNYKTLWNQRWVSSSYPMSLRGDIVHELSWNHFKVAAAEPDRMDRLQQAVENHWSVKALREAIHPPEPAKESSVPKLTVLPQSEAPASPSDIEDESPIGSPEDRLQAVLNTPTWATVAHPTEDDADRALFALWNVFMVAFQCGAKDKLREQVKEFMDICDGKGIKL